MNVKAIREEKGKTTEPDCVVLGDEKLGNNERHGDSLEAIRAHIFKEDGADEGRSNKAKSWGEEELVVIAEDSLCGSDLFGENM